MVKVILIGDSGVGKTNLLRRYTKDDFDREIRATIGVDFSAMEYEYKGRVIKVQFWDTAGQEKYRSIAESYFRNAHGAVIVFDLTDKKSFENLEQWRQELTKTGNKLLDVVVTGNKVDLDGERKVGLKEGQDWCLDRGY